MTLNLPNKDSPKKNYLFKDWHQEIWSGANPSTIQIWTPLIKKDRVEMRGFGSFSTRERKARLARNPKTGSSITVSSKFHPYFRASKSLRESLNN